MRKHGLPRLAPTAHRTNGRGHGRRAHAGQEATILSLVRPCGPPWDTRDTRDAHLATLLRFACCQEGSPLTTRPTDAPTNRTPAHGRFHGRAAFVTGASSGIGQAVAVALAGEGARLAIGYHKDKKGAAETKQRAAQARGGRQADDDLLVGLDVSEPNDVAAAFDLAVDTFGHLDLLVNDAGMQIEESAHETDAEAFDRPIEVNLRGPFLCARRAISHFLSTERPGVILNVSSVHETIPKPLFIGYSASKGGLGNVTRTLALEYADKGIRVNAIAPGAVATPMNPWAADPQARAEVESHIPLGYAAEPDDIVPAALFLASDEARYITGQTLYVDGGLTLYPDFRTPWSS